MKLLILSVIFTFSWFISFSQNEANMWYFGDGAGLDFNSGAPVSLSDGAMNPWEGSSSIADEFGNLLFYTDGSTIWNNEHNIMPNGSDLLGGLGGSSTQSSLIVRQPGSDDLYFVFTVDQEGGASGFRYTLVDMSLDGGLGDVVLAEKNILLITPVSEKVSGVVHANETDIWVVTHGFDNDEFYSFLVTSGGVTTTPVVSTEGSIATNSHGQLKISPNGKYMAMGLGAINIVELFDFDAETGIVSNMLFTEDYSALADEVPYGTETYGIGFSSNSKRLYLSFFIGTSGYSVRQYDLTAVDILASEITLGESLDPTEPASFCSIQLAPDGKIYLADILSTNLGVINDPNELGAACDFVVNGFTLTGGGSCNFGLPNFIQSIFAPPPPPPPVIGGTNFCIGETTSFWNESESDSLLWDFGDPPSGTDNFSTDSLTEHTYDMVGDYTVTLVSFFCGIPDTVSEVITINPIPTVDLGPDTTICNGEVHTLDATTAGASYSWSDMSTEATLTTGDAGTYSVTITDPFGCMTSDEITISLDGVSLDLGSDVTICEGDSFEIIPTVSSTPDTYLWSDASVAPSLTVSSAGSYSLTVTQGACTSTDAILIMEETIFSEFNVSDTIGCLPNEVSFYDLSTTSSSITSWNWDFGDGSSSTLQNPTHFYMGSGTYTVDLTITTALGCVSDTGKSVTIEVYEQPIADFSFSPNDPDPMMLIQFTDESTNPNTWYWRFGDGSNASTSDPQHQYNSPGIYEVVLVVENGICIDSTAISLTVSEDIIFYVPNAFTPDGDPFNQVFSPVFTSGFDPYDYHFTIYNRWGEVVFESYNSTVGWDGTYGGGSLVEDGVYIWQIEFGDINDDKKLKKQGHVTVLK